MRDKFLQEAKQQAEAQLLTETRQAKECEVKKILDNLTEQEISLLKYVLDKSGIIWLPDTNTQVLGLRAAGLIEVFDKDMSCYRGEENRQICSPYKFTGFTTDNQNFMREYLSSKYGLIEVYATMSSYQAEDKISLP